MSRAAAWWPSIVSGSEHRPTAPARSQREHEAEQHSEQAGVTEKPDKTTIASTAKGSSGANTGANTGASPARRGAAWRGPRAELSRRPLHRRVSLVAASALSLVTHAVLLSAWWSGVQAATMELASRHGASAHSAVRVEHTVVHIAQLPPAAHHALIDDPPDEPDDEPEVTLLAAPEPVRSIPDVAWFDSAGDSVAAFTIRARRPRRNVADGPAASAPALIAKALSSEASRPQATAAGEASDALGESAADVLEPVAPAPATPETDPASGSDGAEVTSPRPTSDNRPPRYPGAARRRGWEGRVVLHVLVDAGGAALSVEIVESSGRELLDLAALEAVTDWTFTAAHDGTRAVSGETDVSVRFELMD